jgi:hypothetical protein
MGLNHLVHDCCRVLGAVYFVSAAAAAADRSWLAFLQLSLLTTPFAVVAEDALSLSPTRPTAERSERTQPRLSVSAGTEGS